MASALFFCLFGFKVDAAPSLDVVINGIAWPVKAAYAANGLKMGIVTINEIAWMGTTNSANDEWIELCNNTNSQINLAGWELISRDGSLKINLAGMIPAAGFYLLERTDDKSSPGVTADQIYKGALTNSGKSLQLYDNQGDLIDSVDCASGWFGGDNQTKQTMERKNSLQVGNDSQNWQTSENPAGTPKTQNSEGAILDKKVSVSNKNQLAGKYEPIPSEEDETITDLKNKGAAAIGEFSNETGQRKDVFPLSALLIALTISLFSGILILLIKKNIKTNI